MRRKSALHGAIKMHKLQLLSWAPVHELPVVIFLSSCILPKLPISYLSAGMAGSGKTTLIQRLASHLCSENRPPYIINMDPAVLHVPYAANIDIRDTVSRGQGQYSTGHYNTGQYRTLQHSTVRGTWYVQVSAAAGYCP
jgi:hypothetical protein